LKKTGAFFGNASFSKKDSFDKPFSSKEKSVASQSLVKERC
jgi:hypothetical protein